MPTENRISFAPPVSTTAAETAIKAVLQSYRDALIASSTSAVMKLYAPDGVLMAQHIHTITGADGIRATYDKIFEAIHLDVDFDIVEVQAFSSEWAFARTTSEGTQKDMKSGGESKEGNQELFVLKIVAGEWKIARYCFCTTNPPK